VNTGSAAAQKLLGDKGPLSKNEPDSSDVKGKIDIPCERNARHCLAPAVEQRPTLQSPDEREPPPYDYLVRVMMAPMSAAIPPAVITIPIVCIWERLRPGSQ